jgi:SAM-dependent methyltransferase
MELAGIPDGDFVLRLLGKVGRRLDRLEPLVDSGRSRLYRRMRSALHQTYYRRSTRLQLGETLLPPDARFTGGVKLNLGSGSDIRPGWLNVDLRPVGDVVGTAVALPFADCSVDYLLARDLLEHFPHDETAPALLEWHRVLRPGGWLEVRVPNMLYLSQLLRRNVDVDAVMDNVFGGHRWGANGAFDTHHWGWTPVSLERDLAQAGFVAVANDRAANMTVQAVAR